MFLSFFLRCSRAVQMHLAGRVFETTDLLLWGGGGEVKMVNFIPCSIAYPEGVLGGLSTPFFQYNIEI